MMVWDYLIYAGISDHLVWAMNVSVRNGLGQGHVSIGPSTIGRWLFILNFEIERHPICSLRKTDEEMICYCTNGFGHTIM